MKLYFCFHDMRHVASEYKIGGRVYCWYWHPDGKNRLFELLETDKTLSTTLFKKYKLEKL